MVHRVVYTRPYDAEVEYLESTGTQRIDTGVLYRSNVGIECEVAFTDTADNNIAFRNFITNGILGLLVYGNKIIAQRIVISNNGVVNIKADTNFHIIKNYPTYCKIDNKQGSVSGEFIYDGPNTIELYRIGRLKIKYFKIYQDTSLVRDLIPVRIGTKGYMYDKVSGKLFGNKGTGNFILGSDVANPIPNIRRVFRFGNKRCVMPMPYDSKIEYLESTGTQYIDTAIYGSNNSKVEVDLQLLELGASKAIFGCYSKNNSLYIYQAGGKGSGKWQLGFGYNADVGTTDTNRHSFVFDNFDIKIDGTIIFSHTPRNFTTPLTLLMFNMHNNKGEIYSSTRMMVFSCKLYNGNTLVRNFIPVRRGNVGYMYDRVSGRLFGNSGTGQFILGNDIND